MLQGKAKRDAFEALCPPSKAKRPYETKEHKSGRQVEHMAK